MMKKLFALALALLLALSLAACGGKAEAPATTEPTAKTEEPAPAPSGGEADANPVVNGENEGWVCQEISMSYIFSADGTYKSYADDPWKWNGDGTYACSGNTVDLDDKAGAFTLEGDTLKTPGGRVYVRTTPFAPSAGELDPAGEYQGSTAGAAALANITDKNYKEAAKSVFGVEIQEVSGLELKKAESGNGVNNLSVTFAGSNLENAKAAMEYYFDQCKALSDDGGVYSVEVNFEKYTVSRGTKYEDFEAYYEAAATRMETLYQSQWIYDNHGADVQFSIMIDGTQTDLTFVLLG